MKKKLSRVLAVLLGVLMLAVCIPAAAFAEEATELPFLGYYVKFDSNSASGETLSKPGDSVTVPTVYYGEECWKCGDCILYAGDTFTYEMAEKYFGKDYNKGLSGNKGYYCKVTFEAGYDPTPKPTPEPTTDVTFKLHVWYATEAYLEHFTAKHVNLDVGDMNEPYCDVEKTNEVVATGVNSITLPTEVNGQKVLWWYYAAGPSLGNGRTITKEDLSTDWRFSTYGADKQSEINIYAVVPGLYPDDVRDAFLIFYAWNGSGKSWDEVANEYYSGKTASTDTTPEPTAPAATTFVPQLQSQSSEPAVTVDTRTEQQKEIDEAIANGTWGIEYTTCQKCGYHNWTRQGNVYVCDTCGNTTTEVVSAKGVKGYVGSGAIAAVAPGKTVDDTPKYATAKEAQAAADKREAAYAAAVAAFQKQIAEQNAAYLASLK